jgi:hypothetical protein
VIAAAQAGSEAAAVTMRKGPCTSFTWFSQPRKTKVWTDFPASEYRKVFTTNMRTKKITNEYIYI